MEKRLTRAEVPVEQTWNLTDIFPTVAAWETALNDAANSIVSVAQYRGRLAEGPDVMLACLNAQEELMEKFVKVSSYAQLNLATDGTLAANQAMAGQAAALGAKIEAGTAFFRSETLALPDGTIERYLAAEPKLAEFRRTLDKLVEDKPHTLAPETESALASLGEVLDAPYMIYGRSKAADMTFAPIKDSQGNTLPMSFATYESRYQRSADVTLRRNAWASFTEGLKAYKNTFAATWATEVKKNVAMARVRGWESATHYLLARQESDIDVYNNLHDIILKEVAPHFRKYVELRKRVLGLDKILYCEIESPLDPEYAPSATFEQAGEIVLKGLSVLGKDYTAIIERGLKERWVDWADNVGKSTGAFCDPLYGVHPYVLITWSNNVRNALTLSHELGHAAHGVLGQREHRLHNADASMFFSEAPSICNELLVANSILQGSNDKRMRRYVITQLLMIYYHEFVRHLIEGELQRRLYAVAERGGTITADMLCTVQGEILKEFWGDTIVIDDGARLTWMRQPHYYMGLYPYSYSAGLTVSTAVAQAIEKEGQPAIDRWLKVLKAGGSVKPLELARMAGVDMSKPEPIRAAVAYVGKLIDEVVMSF